MVLAMGVAAITVRGKGKRSSDDGDGIRTTVTSVNKERRE